MAAKKTTSRPTKPAAKRTKRAQKTAENTAGSAGVAISPLNGARIPLGAHPGNTGGKPGRSGRIKEKVKRQLLRAAAKQGAGVLESIAGGELVERMQVRLLDVLPHVRCPGCGLQGMKPKGDLGDAALITFEGKVSASPRDRRGAVDTMLKYSVGLKDELTLVHPDVQHRLEQTVALIGSRETWNSAELLAALSPTWRQ